MEKNGPLDGRKITKIIKTAKWDKSHQKINIKKIITGPNYDLPREQHMEQPDAKHPVWSG
jgi:hypothetical protein